MNDSDDIATCKQRERAAAFGVEIPPNVSRARLSALMDDAKPRLNGPPNTMQRRLAHEWRVDIADAQDGWEACRRLMAFVRARRWVYSVCRRQAAARWRFYSQSGLPEDAVRLLAHWFLAQPGFSDSIRSWNVPDSTTGDAWCRLTDVHCAEFEPYLATAARVHDAFGFAAVKPQKRQPRQHARQRKTSQSGCFVVLATIGLVLGAFVVVRYAVMG